MNENEMIQTFAEIHHLNTHVADAEPFGNMLFSMDSFSENEDFFTHTPPEIIGRNLAAGACSDLLACGVKPQMLIQSWNIDESKGSEYYQKIAEGIENVLACYGAKCIGGDLGTSIPWCWTATVGAQKSTDPITRKTKQRIPFDLYISGTMGEANLAAFQQAAMPEIKLREPVPSNALFSTDSSGGFFDALENFRRVNSGMHLEFDILKVISPEVFIKWPENFDPSFTLIGGVGEYELVYGMPKDTAAPGIRIGGGDFSDCAENDFRWQHGKMKNPPPDYRNIGQENWIAATNHYLREMLTP